MTWILRVLVAAAVTLALLCAVIPAVAGALIVGAMYALWRAIGLSPGSLD